MSEQQNEIVKRLDVMEFIARDGSSVERDEAGSPHDGLPIGAPFPDFSIANGGGKVVTFENILAERKPTFFVFVSPTCIPCGSLLPEVMEWQDEMREKLNFVIISTGSRDLNIKKFGEEIAGQVLLEDKRELAEKVQAKWTPTGVLVSSEGFIQSHPASGDTAIRRLADKIRHEDLTRDFLYFTETNVTGKPPLIGKSIPEFSLEDLDGRKWIKDDLIGKETLAIFWGTDCPHCVRMMPEIQEWDKSRSANDPNLIVFSEGDPGEHRELGLSSPILLEKGHKTAIGFGMFGTPSAVLIDEQGRIVTETAIGAGNIWALIGK
ncbi:MAG: redoxin domain-containing protein, partial [Saprospiraceae bacterium]|nr:redoxin domain-containing protein [Pyrinomonadaceae bacterium]